MFCLFHRLYLKTKTITLILTFSLYLLLIIESLHIILSNVLFVIKSARDFYLIWALHIGHSLFCYLSIFKMHYLQSECPHIYRTIGTLVSISNSF